MSDEVSEELSKEFYSANWVTGLQVHWPSASLDQITEGLITSRGHETDYGDFKEELRQRMEYDAPSVLDNMRTYRLERQCIIEGIKSEMTRLKTRSDKAKMDIEYMDERVKEHMEDFNIQKVATNLATYSIKKNPASLVVIADIESENYEEFKKTTVAWDRSAIKKAMKTNKELVESGDFELVQKTRLQVD